MARICEWFAMMVSTKQDLLFLPAHYHRNSTSWVQSICKVTEKKMTKADLVSRISDKTGIERQDVQATVPRLGWEAHPVLASTKEFAACCGIFLKHSP